MRINDNMDICAKIQQLSQINKDDLQGHKSFKEELGSIYYVEKCGFNLDRNKLNIMKIEEPFNYDLHQVLDAAKSEADEKDPIIAK